MDIIGAFQTPIFVGQIALPNIRHLVWSRNINNFWQTTPELNKDKILEQFMYDILGCVSLYNEKIGYVKKDFFITQMWANRYESNEGIHTHHHANSMYSGVVYFDDIGSTVFYRESNIKNVNQIPIQQETAFTNDVYEIPSAPGRIVIFPSYIVHNSTNNTNSQRTTISFNTFPTELGDPSRFNYLNLNR